MMDDFELNELEAGARRPASSFKRTNWRPQITMRLLQRVRLIAAWIYVTVLPRFWWRVLASMILITGGRLADAASFIVGVHIITRAASAESVGTGELQQGLIWAAIAIASIILIASALGYLGNSLAAKLALKYQRLCLAEGLAIVRHYRERKSELPPDEVRSVTRQAPRMMARSLLQVIGACTSLIMLMSGLIGCVFLFPALTGIILLCLILISPLYVVAALHSTNIGHSIRMSSPAHGMAIRQIEKKWAKAKVFSKDEILKDLDGSQAYNEFNDAYRARLTLSAWNSLLSNLTLALITALATIWIALEVEITAESIATIVSYLIALRLFGQGLAGIFSSIQTINTLLPFYLKFLMRDPRFFKFDQTTL